MVGRTNAIVNVAIDKPQFSVIYSVGDLRTYTFPFDEGMTFFEYVDSAYNDQGWFQLDGDTVLFRNSWLSEPSANDLIEDGAEYYTG